MIVQIYEIQSPEEAQLVVGLGVDHVGSVLLSTEHWQDSSIKEAVAVVQAAGRKSSLIPLFHDPDLIAQAIRYYQPDIIHFCETLPANGSAHPEVSAALERQKSIRKRFPGMQIMRSIPIAQAGNGPMVPSLTLAALFEPFSDWFLTDTLLLASPEVSLPEAPPPEGSLKDQPVSGFVGITGQTCDWSVARDLVQASHIPVILAGGIGPANTRQGIELVKPAGVDSCTRTNALDADGKPIRFKKDPEKVRALVQAARALPAQTLSDGSNR
ncbi:MAG: phosphoribosylanthranilate isomerase [Desulfatitalea sp.]|nr:phosphoribosylanthranilate isomerase [Desulfatitalea sp.]MBI5897270.1 phosphoribosylanthranilate isomerase [Desulfobacterales bacterium]